MLETTRLAATLCLCLFLAFLYGCGSRLVRLSQTTVTSPDGTVTVTHTGEYQNNGFDTKIGKMSISRDSDGAFTFGSENWDGKDMTAQVAMESMKTIKAVAEAAR